MPFFSSDKGNVEAVQFDRMNFNGRPMFKAALPPWFTEATAREKNALGAITWSDQQTFVQLETGPSSIDPGDWIVRWPDGQIQTVDVLSFTHLFDQIEQHDQE